MGNTKMSVNALDEINVYRDSGEASIEYIKRLELNQNITLPNLYVTFITQHNGARLDTDVFNFYDPNRLCQSSDSIAFSEIEEIQDTINILLEVGDNDFIEDIGYFNKRLIPFGYNGGGDYICFDYRKCSTDNPPVVIWFHDVDVDDSRVAFVAQNFEEFVNMLHEPDDLEDSEREFIQQEQEARRQKLESKK